jgi:hypothetical protein
VLDTAAVDLARPGDGSALDVELAALAAVLRQGLAAPCQATRSRKVVTPAAVVARPKFRTGLPDAVYRSSSGAVIRPTRWKWLMPNWRVLGGPVSAMTSATLCSCKGDESGSVDR